MKQFDTCLERRIGHGGFPTGLPKTYNPQLLYVVFRCIPQLLYVVFGRHSQIIFTRRSGTHPLNASAKPTKIDDRCRYSLFDSQSAPTPAVLSFSM